MPDLPSLAVSLLAVSLAGFLFSKNRSKSLPPGPPGVPFLGNAIELSRPRPWITYTEWSKKYGDFVYLTAAGQPIVVISSRKAINELLDHRGSIYSDRPRLVMSGELIGYGDGVPLISYGNRHREYRKLMSEALAPGKVQEYYSLQEGKVREFLERLLDTPDSFASHIRWIISAIVFKITHGHNVSTGEDEFVRIAEQANTDFSEASVPGAYVVDVFPFLAHLPRWLNLNWMKKLDEFRHNKEIWLHKPYDAVKEEMETGNATPSFVSRLIERNKDASPAQEEIYKWVSGAFYAGGSDTTVASVRSFFLAMSLYPEVQKNAKEEIKRVVGTARLPSFSDRPNLPYIESLLWEVHRWNPVAPTAIPHRLTKDDVYEGYFLPAGTLVIPNSWGVLHDPEVYTDPFEFKPERYLNKTTNNGEVLLDPRRIAFGYGRRICPGRDLADNTLFILIAMVLAVFDILPEETANSKRPNFALSEGYTNGIVSHPETFECKVVPQSDKAAQLIRDNDITSPN